jgi:hypothetical protein
MKKLILLICILFSANVFGQVPSYVPSNGLVGWWPFNGNANDESGNGNNGVVNGATLTNDRLGNGNKAYSFNGLNNYIEVANASSLQFSASTQTISFWLKIPSLPAPVDEQGIFEKMDQHLAIDITGNAAQGFQIHFDSNGNISYRIKSGNGSSWSLLAIPSNMILLNQYSHVVFVNDNDSIRSYLNGIRLSGTKITPGTTIGLNSNPLLMGKELWTSLGANMDYFDGDLDDIGIWDRALTQQEILNLYNGSLPTTCAGSNLPIGLANGLVAWYPFCGNANDETGNGNNGVVNGATLTNDRFGNTSGAYSFNGTSDYILTSLMPPTAKTPRTISFWSRTNDSNIMTPTDYGDANGSGGSYQLVLNSPCAGVGLDVSSGVVTRGDTSLINNNWHHCVVVYDSLFGNTISDAKIFIDGVEQVSIACSAVNPNENINTVSLNPLNIGSTFSGARFFHGDLDDIGIWDRAISQQEITNLYNTGICYQTITVTDTLIINAILTGFNPVVYQNSIKVYPNPSNDHITIDCGSNYNTLNGYSLRIDNLLSQTVYTTSITQQSYYIDLNTWTGNGVYLIYLINDQGTPIDVRKIVIQ